MSGKIASLALALCLLLSLAACGGGSSAGGGGSSSAGAGSSASGSSTSQASDGSGSSASGGAASSQDTDRESTELIVFAAASMTETLDEIVEAYKDVDPSVTVIPTYESSGTLLKQIQAGAECDLFISAAPTQMNTLEEEGGVLEGTRLDLLENQVTLAVPEGNPKGVESFDDLVQKLKDKDVFLAMGNSDVPVGQYTQKIFAFYGLDEEELAADGLITYGSNVKEVTTQVKEAAADCGVIYATDAFSDHLTVVDAATAEMCGQVLYPAAVLAQSAHPEQAKAFLDYLTGPEASSVFKSVGFTPLANG